MVFMLKSLEIALDTILNIYRNFYDGHHDLVYVIEYLCHKWPRYVPFGIITIRSFIIPAFCNKSSSS